MKQKKTTIVPVGHHLVVEPITLPEKSKGGIIVQHKGSEWDKLAKASRMIGTIVAIGPQCWKAHAASLLDVSPAGSDTLEPWAKVGDVIFYNRHAGKFMFDPVLRWDEDNKPPNTDTDMREMYVINDDDVIAVLPPLEEWTVDASDVMTY